MKKILVVDDDLAICNMLKKFLTKKDYEVMEERPHVVLLDIRMPGMDGIEALKQIREVDKEVGVVMITAVEDEETGKKCVEFGAYDYVIKPLSLDYLETVLTVKLIDFL